MYWIISLLLRELTIKGEVMELKVYQLEKGIYQVEAGKKAIVIPAKSREEAVKKACKYLSLNCNKIITKTSLKAKR